MIKSVNVNLNTGGKIKVFNDPGKTHEVVYGPLPEKAWQRKEREMNERARNYFSVSAKERALELLLLQQVSGHNK